MDLNVIKKRVDLPRFLNKKGLVGVAAELGVARGEFSAVISNSEFDHVYSIDRWAGDRGHGDKQFIKAKKRLSKYPNNTVLKKDFLEASELFADEYFDFVYVDGYAHTGQLNGSYLETWWKKVKPGGVFSGHDYHKEWKLNIEVIDKFIKKHELELFLTKEDEFPSWMTVKSNEEK